MNTADAGSVQITQLVAAVGGFAYGTIGADIHVFGDGPPQYLLTNFSQNEIPSATWLCAMPSRMLDARFGVVDFTGRQAERAELHRWCRAGTRLAIRWMYGPGGQGKTRLANTLASDAAAGGWKVVTATQGTVVLPPPGSQDVRTAGAAGLLLIVDYADRWPLHHLTWLLSNALLYQDLPTRVLLLARSNRLWPALHAEIERPRVQADAYELRPLTNTDSMRERGLMFSVARDCFARRYGLSSADTESIHPPAMLTEPDFGSILTIHMAALAAVDARAHHVTTSPTDTASLSTYLLRRERLHWTAMYENRLKGTNFATPPNVMARAVFVAGLLGPISHGAGLDALRTALADFEKEVSLERVLADHSSCYPPAEAGYALEPLYPDRLAEDFLALSLPGHSVEGYMADSWSAKLLHAIIAKASQERTDELVSTAFGLLADAAGRWPHLLPHLCIILDDAPGLAIRAGGNTLITIAGIDSLPLKTLFSLARVIPRPTIRRPGIDYGIALVVTRLLQELPESSKRDEFHAVMLAEIGVRYKLEGITERAAPAFRESIALWRSILKRNRNIDNLSDMAGSLTSLSQVLRATGELEEALDAAVEAYDIQKRLALRGRIFTNTLPFLTAQATVGMVLAALERYEDASIELSAASFPLNLVRKRSNQETSGRVAISASQVASDLSDVWLHLGKLDKSIRAGRKAVSLARSADINNPVYWGHLLGILLAYMDCITDIERLSRGRSSFQNLISPIAEALDYAARPTGEAASPQLEAKQARLMSYRALYAFSNGNVDSALGFLKDAHDALQGDAGRTTIAAVALPEIYGIHALVMSATDRRADTEEGLRRSVENWYNTVDYAHTELDRKFVFRRLSLAFSNLANCQRENGKTADAIDMYSRSIEILRDLAKGGVRLYQLHLAADLRDLADCYKAIGKKDLAERAAKEAAKL